MKQFKKTQVNALVSLTCDTCGQEGIEGEYEFSEFISIHHQCSYGSIHGDGNQVSIDLCQQCFADMCGDSLTVTNPFGEAYTSVSDAIVEYQNIFSVISKSKNVAKDLKEDSDIRIGARDISLANKVTTDVELQVALKRVEQLWDAQYYCAEGNELHKLAALICVYEKKDWNSYFNQSPVASDDFMSDRIDIVTESPRKIMGKASGILSDTPINPNIDSDDSRQSSIDDENDI